MGLFVAPTNQQDLHVNIDLSSSDVTLFGNPLPLLSACHCLLDLSHLPFQEITDFSIGDESGVTNTGSDNDTETLDDDPVVVKTRSDLSTSVTADIGSISILFLVDEQEVSRGLLQFAVNSMQLKLTTLGMAAELLISN